MSKLIETIIVTSSEHRPCYVDGQRALFHKWEERSDIYAPSMMVGGHQGGQVKHTLAIVELESGEVKTVSPEKIKFVDNRIKDYAFPEEESTVSIPKQKNCIFEETARAIKVFFDGEVLLQTILTKERNYYE